MVAVRQTKPFALGRILSTPGALAAIEDKIRRNTAEVLTRARSGPSTPRAAATAMAVERVRAAQSLRRFG